MTEREYKRLRREIEERYKSDLEALERIWELSRRDAPADRGQLKGLLKQVVERAEGPFTAESIRREIEMIAPGFGAKPASVSRLLKRLAEQGDIAIVEKGEGRRPTKYARDQGEEGAEVMEL